MSIAWIPLIVCLVGLLIAVLSDNGKVVEIGKAMFWTGLLVTLFVLSSHTLNLAR